MMRKNKAGSFMVLFGLVVLFLLAPLRNARAAQYTAGFTSIEGHNIKPTNEGRFRLIYSLEWSLFRDGVEMASSEYSIEGSKIFISTSPEIAPFDSVPCPGRNYTTSTAVEVPGSDLYFSIRVKFILPGDAQSRTATTEQVSHALIHKKGDAGLVLGPDVVRLTFWRSLACAAWVISPPLFDVAPIWPRFREKTICPECSNNHLKEFLFEAKKSYDLSTPGGKVSYFILHSCLWLMIWACWHCASKTRFRKIFPLDPMRARRRSGTFDREGKYRAGIHSGFISFCHQWKRANAEMQDALIIKMSESSSRTTTDAMVLSVWKEKGKALFDNLGKELLALDQKVTMQSPSVQVTDSDTNVAVNPGLSLDRADVPISNPTLRVLRPGVLNLRNNAMRWYSASQEVDRGIENQAASEIEQLKMRSRLDVLWYVAAVAPLSGLFGTVTGITDAFRILGRKGSEVTQAEIVKILAPGINEALWTTIFGLIIAMIAMAIHSLYSRKIDWIYNKWDEIYVDISSNI